VHKNLYGNHKIQSFTHRAKIMKCQSVNLLSRYIVLCAYIISLKTVRQSTHFNSKRRHCQMWAYREGLTGPERK